jgi:hypothetical protein
MSRETRTIHGSSARASEEPVATDRSAQSDPAASSAERDDQRERLDAVAGSEFVDDRIRLEE